MLFWLPFLILVCRQQRIFRKKAKSHCMQPSIDDSAVVSKRLGRLVCLALSDRNSIQPDPSATIAGGTTAESTKAHTTIVSVIRMFSTFQINSVNALARKLWAGGLEACATL